ncbi:MAG: HsdR family type I site-specific deoxyribonuclease, partial [Candidatus Tectomicrobia bacterium]|nr:HsdR family type I site-specific deoxyribonuclease [Candidatus Tectomicrobia bacterium]
MTNFANEKSSVQDPLAKYADDIGWAFISESDALTMRRGETGVFFYNVLRGQLLALNPNAATEENVDEVIRLMENVRASIEGNAETLAWLRGERSIFVLSEKRERNVTVVDFEHPERNVFHVTVEWKYTPVGRKGNRADVMFLINGIPVALVEAKSAKKPDGIDRGFDQIRRYHRETPELVTHAQIFDVTHLIDFYYGATWNLDRTGLFNWKDEEQGSFEKKVRRFFDRERFLMLLRDWIIFFRKNDELHKVILRQHQARAVEKVVARAADPIKRRGLVWHTQGSGKTFTMIKAAQQIMHHPLFEKPTIIMLVDRNELEGQLSGWIASVLGEQAAVVAESKRMLRELLRADYRGLIVSMIHKFDKADANLCTRENVIVLVDEAHRTTGGDLGNYLVGALPNATLIGFTGTPIDKTAYGQGTFKIFGQDDPQSYLDKYSIAESIEDGTTLPLRYTLAPNEIRVPLERLEKEFFALAETEGMSDIEELNRILDKSVTLKAFLKSSDRIDKVAK